jgi:NAD(P)-dependent dehydrogenase (short-subunit alcohol dehydrogenase family)
MMINLVRTAVGEYGARHRAFNNAGVHGCARPLTEGSLEQWQRTLELSCVPPPKSRRSHHCDHIPPECS